MYSYANMPTLSHRVNGGVRWDNIRKKSLTIKVCKYIGANELKEHIYPISKEQNSPFLTPSGIAKIARIRVNVRRNLQTFCRNTVSIMANRSYPDHILCGTEFWCWNSYSPLIMSTEKETTVVSLTLVNFAVNGNEVKATK